MDDAFIASELVRFFWPIVSGDPGQYDLGVLGFWKSSGSGSPASHLSTCAAAGQLAMLSRGTEMNYPVFGNIPHLITSQAALRPEAIALEDEGRKLTFGELGQLTAWLVADLRRGGVRRGDRVAVVIPNGLEMSIALLGVCSAATAAPLNPVYREHEFCDYFREMRVSHLVIPRGDVTAARAAALKLGIRVLELLPGAKAIVPEKSESVMREGEPPEIDSPDAQDIALILLTSGSTGRSKKVPLTHRNICVSVADVARTLELTPEDRCLCMWEQFHIGGLVDLLLVPLASGGTVICTGGFDAAKFYQLLESARPTWYQGVPATVHELLAHARKHGITAGKSSLRLVRVTASALSPQLMDGLEKFFGVPVITTFGMTEAAPLITTNLLPPKVRKAGSTGPSCGPEVAVTDEDGRLLPVGEIGEVVVRGENVFSGYEDAPEANARSFRDGWFRTGDTGYIDGDGYLFLKGRIKETINRGGEKIAPQEIDDVLLSHPGIAEAVSFHIPHKVLGEDVAAAIVPRNPGTLTEEEVRDFVAARLADFKVPRKIVFVEGFERNASGKVNRSVLAGNVGLLGPSDYRQPVTEMEKLLSAVWKKELGVSRVGATDTFAGLGGDSLSTLRMVFELEKHLGRRLSAEILGMISLGANSLEKIASFLQANSTEEQPPSDQDAGAAATAPSAMREELSIDDVRSMVVVMSSGSIPTHRPGSPVKSLHLAGSKPPLFWVFNSPEEEMKALGAALGPDQPIYGFYSGSNTVDREKLSAVAEYYLHEVHSIAPEGALVLGGNCRGGRVAIRLAKRLHEVGRQVSHLCILEMFERSLYDFGGNLQMMFGKQSSEFRYRDFHWGKPGWERPFKRPPRIKWVQGKHASYFSPQNVGVLSATVSSFLADQVDSATLMDRLRDPLLRAIHRVPPVFDAYVRQTTRA